MDLKSQVTVIRQRAGALQVITTHILSGLIAANPERAKLLLELEELVAKPVDGFSQRHARDLVDEILQLVARRDAAAQAAQQPS